MYKSVLTVLLFALLSIAFAQYQPNYQTQLEVQAAANFTDGFIIPCDLPVVDAYYNVCVDASRTPWDVFDLMEWSDYGLSRWTIVSGWERLSSGMAYSTMLVNFARNEALYIGVSDYFIMYRVIHLDD